MKKIFSSIAFSALVFSCVPLARAESLYDAVESAIGGHPSVAAARAAQSASGETVREQRSAYFPELSANITGGRLYGDNATSRGLSVTRGAGYSNLGEGSAQLSQRVYDWGETGNRVDAAKARAQAADSGVIGAREGIALRAAQAYIALLRASDLKDAASANLTTTQDYQTRIAAQVAEGGSDDAELNRANDFLLLAQNAATEFEGQYQQALADYIEAVGKAPGGALKRPGEADSIPATVDEAVQAAFDTHPQLAGAKQAVLAGDHDERAESTAYLPKVSAQVSYLKRDQRDIIGGEAIDARAVMKMDWAYSTGGAQLARQDRAAFLTEQAKAQLDETYRQVERNVRVAWSALDIARRQQETQSGRRDATAKVVETYKTQYEGGNRSLIELMQAESQAFDARVAYDNADFGVLNSGYAVSAAMGVLVGVVEAGPALAAAREKEAVQAVSAPVEKTPVAPAPVKQEPITQTSVTKTDMSASTLTDAALTKTAAVRTTETPRNITSGAGTREIGALSVKGLSGGGLSGDDGENQTR